MPDVLVMTATPIPRTAAMLVYGDLDKSELREMPPGRTPIATEVVGPSPLDQVAACGDAARRGRGRPPGVRRVPARGGQGQGRGQGRDRRVRTAAGRGARRACASGCCTARCTSKEKEAGDGRVPRRRARRARRDDRDRGRRRRAERDRDDRRGRRPLRPLAAAPAARPRRARRRRVVVLPRRRPDHRRRRSAHGGDGRVAPTGSCSPRRTSRSAARARCSASSSRG